MDQYREFYGLHHQEGPFLLANAWNVKSAQLIEKAGFKAIATSSGAIANSLGYDDGEKMPFGELLYIVQRIKKCTTIPLSVDMERGYADDLNVLSDNLKKLLDCGVSGINIEDAQGEEVYLKKLSFIKNYLVKTSQSLFINARTDAFLQKLPFPFKTTLRRAIAYKDAGADGLFVTGISDATLIHEITASTTLPVNIVATPALSSLETLTNCGVKRISMAGFLYGATYKQLGKICETIQAEKLAGPFILRHQINNIDMESTDFTSTIFTDQSPEESFHTVLNVRAWWSGLFDESFEGSSEKLGDEFSFSAGGGVHYSKHKLVEFVPGKKVVWLVTDSNLSFADTTDEWTGTRLVFDISREGKGTKIVFTHSGLVPEFECYTSCAPAWTQYIQEQLTDELRKITA